MIQPRNVTLLTGCPGGGKSHEMRGDMIERPGLSVFALPTIDLLREQETKLRHAAPDLPLFSAHSNRAGRKQVQLQVDKHLATISERGITHCVLLVTHDFLEGGDLTGLTGWRFYIDEPPTAVRAGKLTITRSSLKLWKSEFVLSPVGTWGQLRRAADGKPLRLGLERGDTMLKDLAPLRRAAAGRSGVLFSTDRWKTGVHHWMTIWTPLDLPSTDITMAGAGYLRSLGFKVASKLHGGQLVFEEREVVRPRTGQPTVTIRYFADWECSSPHWATWPGLGDLKAIADHVRKEAPDLGYWSGNGIAKTAMSHRISGTEPSKARLAGHDGMMAHESCAFIYSSKASAHLKPIMSLLDVTKEEVRISAEDEDIFQFAFRGAIRRPEFDGRYDVYLFSKQQAERLKAMLEGSGLHDVSLTHEGDVGVAKKPPKKGRRARAVSADEDEDEDKEEGT